MRALWVRALVQVVLGLLLAYMAVPLLALLNSRCGIVLLPLAMRCGAGQTGILVLTQIGNAFPFLLAGAMAAALTWLLVRRPWDALIGAGCVAAVYAVLHATMHVTTSPVLQWWISVGLVADMSAVFAGCSVVAWLLQKRRESRPADPQQVAHP